MFVDAERVVDDTDAVLHGLTRWLALGTPLTPEYRTFALTGKKGYGDPSPNIMARRIVRDAAERHRDPVAIPEIPEDCIARGREAYAMCRDTLVRCTGVL